MKKLLSIIVAIAFTTVGSLAFADDSTTIWITKSTDSTAKVCTSSKCLGTVKVKFADGASWDSVKDSYEVSSATADALAAKKDAISFDSDGKATFVQCKVACTKAKSTKK